MRSEFVEAQNRLLDAAAQFAAGNQPEAAAAINQAVTILTQITTDIADPSIQAALGSKSVTLAKKLVAAQTLTAKAKLTVDANDPRKNPKAVINIIRSAARGVSNAGLLLGRPLLVELQATTAGFHTPGQAVSFQIDLSGCADAPVITVENAGPAPVVDLASVVVNANTGVLTLRMGLAHGGARVTVTACGHTVRRLLYNYGVAAPRLRLFNPLPRARVAEHYDQLAGQALGGVAPSYFALQTAGGFPPIGIILDLNGRLSGTPSIAGTYIFGVCATDLSGSQTCRNMTLVVDPPVFALTVNKAGGGSGIVTSSPRGINCGATCTASFDSGTIVTLTARPAAGSTFAGWSGAGTGTGSRVLTMNTNAAVTATFNALTDASKASVTLAATAIVTAVHPGTASSPDGYKEYLITYSGTVTGPVGTSFSYPQPIINFTIASWTGGNTPFSPTVRDPIDPASAHYSFQVTTSFSFSELPHVWNASVTVQAPPNYDPVRASVPITLQ